MAARYWDLRIRVFADCEDDQVRGQFPIIDPVGPADMALPEAVGVIGESIAPAAAMVDQVGVPRNHWDLLAAADLLPVGRSAAQTREITELLAGSDASTWFCWAQHASPTHLIAGATSTPDNPNLASLQAQYLPGLRSGALLAATAFAHVRRTGPPNPVAMRTPTGWRVTGTLDWVTSWDIADVVQIMVRGCGPDEDRFVCFLLPTNETPAGLTVGPPLQLLAMSGTHTRPVQLTDVHVDFDQVAAVLDAPTWQAHDAQRTAHASPAIFGLIRGGLAELQCVAEQGGQRQQVAELLEAAVRDCRDLRAAAYALADAGQLGVEDLDTALRLRAAALDLAVQVATSVITQRAGSAMLTGCSAERRLRETMFLQVQAQTAAIRTAMNQRAVQRWRGNGSTRGTEMVVP